MQQPSRPTMDELLDRYEQQWRGSESPNLESFLQQHSVTQPAEVWELTRIDLDHRIRKFASAEETDIKASHFSATAYQRALIERGHLPTGDRKASRVPLSILLTEMKARWAIGDQVTPSFFLNRFRRPSVHAEQQFRAAYCELLLDKGWPRDLRFLDELKISREDFERVLVDRLGMQRELLDSVPSGNASLTASELAEELVRSNQLTIYQAFALTLAQSQPLRIGNYKVLDVLGAGGMAKVYRAIHPFMNRTVAIKLLDASSGDSHEQVRRFRREVEILADLQHPAIVSAYDGGIDANFFYFAMEYVRGVDFDAHVRRSGPFEVSQAFQLIRDVALGLDYAHTRGIIHRDIKPSNLMLETDSGEAKILDLGLAKLSGASSATLTESGIAIGTLRYMAPEQLISENVDQRSDIYALGCTLYFMLTGQHLVGGRNMEIVAGHLAGIPLEKLAFRLNNCPETVAQIHKMVARDPNHRPQSMAEIAQWCDMQLGQVSARTDHCAPERREENIWAHTILLVVSVCAGAVSAWILSTWILK
jgi:tRNA A-37 threonylcarbamoyl transferase component Bud32